MTRGSAAPPCQLSFAPLGEGCYFQFEATWSLSSGSFGSFVSTGTSKRCFPAIPSCIIKSIEIVVD